MKNKDLINVLCVVGTRPEAIKMSPLILKLRDQSWASVHVIVTGQHREIVDRVLKFFEIEPHYNLDVMLENQNLSDLTSRVLIGIDKVISKSYYDLVLVQGDTTTVLAAAMAAFYQKIPVGHVEAGLRTFNKRSPFPEEFNRTVVSRIADLHFASTHEARDNLILENIDSSKVYVTGNTVIDALLIAKKNRPLLKFNFKPTDRIILITIHRRENYGARIEEICDALIFLTKKYRTIKFLYPVHPNPNIKHAVLKKLSNIPNLIICEPLEYEYFVAAMCQSYLILTDSGGVQEEAPALGIPVLVLRDETERPEAEMIGATKVIGTKKENIIKEVTNLVENECDYRRMSLGVSPYGDGNTSDLIVKKIKDFFIRSM